ncbi:cadherin-like domain-containing protein [Vibrio alginolyticus]|uniref:cadherin-like domain-containing protein n=1 Tax=Vibrio alginolyticus TaxID=663 RepID=UPI003B682E70
MNVDVTPVNDAPVATNDNAVTDEDTPVTIDVVDGKLVFTPAENFHGDAEITYTITDGALTDQATVNVTVNARHRW